METNGFEIGAKLRKPQFYIVNGQLMRNGFKYKVVGKNTKDFEGWELADNPQKKKPNVQGIFVDGIFIPESWDEYLKINV